MRARVPQAQDEASYQVELAMSALGHKQSPLYSQ